MAESRRSQQKLQAAEVGAFLPSSVALGLKSTATQMMELSKQHRSLTIWLTILLCFTSVTMDGVYEDVKHFYFEDVDPRMLIVMQAGVSVIELMFIWYIIRRLGRLSELLDSSRHIEVELHEMHRRHEVHNERISDMMSQMLDRQSSTTTAMMMTPNVAYTVQ